MGGSNNQIAVKIGATDSAALSIGGLYGNFASNVSAAGSLASIDSAISTIDTIRGNLGAYQNRLQHSINSLNVAVQNLSASESSIRDTDMASTMVSFTKDQILVQAGVSMLAQANSAPQSVLKLLG